MNDTCSCITPLSVCLSEQTAYKARYCTYLALYYACANVQCTVGKQNKSKSSISSCMQFSFSNTTFVYVRAWILNTATTPVTADRSRKRWSVVAGLTLHLNNLSRINKCLSVVECAIHSCSWQDITGKCWRGRGPPLAAMVVGADVENKHAAVQHSCVSTTHGHDQGRCYNVYVAT